MRYSVIGVLSAEKEINTVRMMAVHMDEWKAIDFFFFFFFFFFVKIHCIVYSKKSLDPVEVICDEQNIINKT